MGALFSPPPTPAMPQIPAAPPPLPTIQSAQDEVRQNEALSRKRAGRASTMLTGKEGDTSATSVATKTLMGQ